MNKHSIRAIARVAHEVNRGYCKALNDHSQVAWDDAPEWQQQSAIHGVEAILENSDMGPEDLHGSWMKEKLEAGWSWGAVKDVENKKHPCLTNYDALPRDQRVKDFIFEAIVKSLMNNPPVA